MNLSVYKTFTCTRVELPIRFAKSELIFNSLPEGHEAYNSMVYYDELHYRLMPYIYSLAGKSYPDDYTIMCGLVMDFKNELKVFNIADQYLVGTGLLINPVYTYKTISSNYLPSSTGWHDIYTGHFLARGQTIKADALHSKIPVYVKEWAIIPTGPDLQYTSEKPADPLRLYVYTGKNGAFDVYEDEGVNYNYEQGKIFKDPNSIQ